MTATVEHSCGVSLAELAGDFGEDDQQPRTRERPQNQPAAEPATPEPSETDTDDTGEDTAKAPRRRRGPRPAGEHTAAARDRITSSEGVAGWRSPTLAEAWAEQDEAIHQWRTKWWTIPRSVQAVAYLVMLAALIGSSRLLARSRYMLTAVVLGGGLWLLWGLWGVGA